MILCTTGIIYVQVCIEQGIFLQEKDMEVENDPSYNWNYICLGVY